jgi:hypothetical protein
MRTPRGTAPTQLHALHRHGECSSSRKSGRAVEWERRWKSPKTERRGTERATTSSRSASIATAAASDASVRSSGRTAVGRSGSRSHRAPPSSSGTSGARHSHASSISSPPSTR